jgi:hypothetical protein
MTIEPPVSYDELQWVLAILLDQIDYERGACKVTEMIGAVLPRELLSRSRETLERSRRAA